MERRLAAILAADLVGYSRLMGQDEAGTVAALKAVRAELIDPRIAEHRGRVFKATGDGFLAAFDGPARAIRCACAISEGVRSLGIEVRAGLHTGECEIMGDEVAGTAVHIGARIAALASAGEVLVSSTVRDLVAGSGLTFVDRGMQPLKGVPDAWHLFAAGVAPSR